MQPPASVRQRIEQRIGQLIEQRGLLYLVGIGLCKLVPAWLVRFRLFSIYRLGIAEPDRDTGYQKASEPEPSDTPDRKRFAGSTCADLQVADGGR